MVSTVRFKNTIKFKKRIRRSIVYSPVQVEHQLVAEQNAIAAFFRRSPVAANTGIFWIAAFRMENGLRYYWRSYRNRGYDGRR
jgi:hypothetical protein